MKSKTAKKPQPKLSILMRGIKRAAREDYIDLTIHKNGMIRGFIDGDHTFTAVVKECVGTWLSDDTVVISELVDALGRPINAITIIAPAPIVKKHETVQLPVSPESVWAVIKAFPMP